MHIVKASNGENIGARNARSGVILALRFVYDRRVDLGQ